ALVNGAIVFGVAVELVRDALQHLADPTMPRSNIMLIVATAALVVNGFSAWVLHGAMHGGHGHGHAHGHAHAGHGNGHGHGHGHGDAGHGHGHVHREEEDEGHHAAPHAHHLNLRGAWLHLLGD